jgi:hypothetical protein
MGIENIRRWQWIVVALVIGVAVGSVRRLAEGDVTSRFPLVLNSQAEFERALLEKGDGVPRFRDLTVYTEKVPGADQAVHVVGGLYTQFHVKDGQTFASPPTRACFIFKPPYQALIDRGKPINPEYTVIDYLASLRGQGVRFRTAWWHSPAASIALWTLGSLILIGGVWPTLVNLIAFGQLTQPPRESFDVGGPSTSTPAAATSAPTEDDLARLRQLDAALEAQLAAGATGATSITPADAPAPAVRALSATPLEPIAAERPEEDREFGADRDDYYPTERHAPPKKPG